MTRKISLFERLLSIFLDHIFVSIIAFLFFIPMMISIVGDAFHVTHEPSNIEILRNPEIFMGLLGFSVYFSKDCLNGRSIAKRILKFQVIDIQTGKVASPLRCLLRDLTIIIWPVELIIILINPARRIGDILAGTKIVSYFPSPLGSKGNLAQIALAIVLAYFYVLILFVPFYFLDNGISNKVQFITSSYDTKVSKRVEEDIEANLHEFLKPDIRVYDSIQNKKIKYVSAICRLKQNYEEDDPDQLRGIHSTIENIILSAFPNEKILGQVKYVYEKEEVLNIRVIDIKLR